MSHILSVKLSPSLLHQLEAAAQKERKSKGHLVRDALQAFLKHQGENTEKKIEAITQSILKNKKPPKAQKVDWDSIYRACRGASSLSPEEEVLFHRRRRL